MKLSKAFSLPVAVACLVAVSGFMLYGALSPLFSQNRYAPGTYSATLGPNMPNGKVNFAKAAFRAIYAIGYGVDGFVVTPSGDLVNVKISNSGDIGCRTDAAAVGRSGDWLYLGCTRVWMGREGPFSVLPCRILKNGWIKPTLPFRVPIAARPKSMTLDAAGQHLYVGTAGGIFQYAIGADGKARPMSPSAAPENANAAGVAISANKKFAYATNFSLNRIYQFSVDSSGRLTPMKPSFIQTGGGPMETHCSLDGKYVWCLDSNAQCVDRFAVRPNGTLTRQAPTALKLGRQASSLDFSPDEKYAYVARYRYNSIFQYRVEPDGSFKLNTPISAPGAGSPSLLRVSPDGRYAAALNFEYGMMSLYAVNRQGTLDPANPSVMLCAAWAHDVLFVPGRASSRS